MSMCHNSEKRQESVSVSCFFFFKTCNIIDGNKKLSAIIVQVST